MPAAPSPRANRAPARGEDSARDKVFATARDLFYREGFRAVGVDAVVAASGVAKTTLYRWFPTKDDLVLAVLDSRDEEFWTQWEATAERYVGQPREELLAQIRWISRYIGGAESRGCAFLNAAAEFPDPSHAVRDKVARNKRTLRRRLLSLCMAAGAADAALLADQLVLMIDGAFAGSEALGKNGPAKVLQRAAQAAIDTALPAK
ncbi:TetR/AcrR family transcriptional regulator [Ramlibacter sp. CrO1]|uniref:TetR/AcrR family transcriptional regulator n=1 Tax=Ramlibacter algicola TaxID=2795217 RepID=A0A934UTM1_9BURK|nr:TetR/AcrR family transcriptional regulator [Ramlibacter algicola]